MNGAQPEPVNPHTIQLNSATALTSNTHTAHMLMIYCRPYANYILFECACVCVSERFYFGYLPVRLCVRSRQERMFYKFYFRKVLRPDGRRRQRRHGTARHVVCQAAGTERCQSAFKCTPSICAIRRKRLCRCPGCGNAERLSVGRKTID